MSEPRERYQVSQIGQIVGKLWPDVTNYTALEKRLKDYSEALEAIRRLRGSLFLTHLLLQTLGKCYPSGPSGLEDEVIAILKETEQYEVK